MALFTDKSNRREFLKTFAGTAGSIAAFGMFHPFPLTAQTHKLNVALLSDLHISEDLNDNPRGFFPSQNLKIASEQIAGSGLQGAMITGDLARLTGKPGDYLNLKQLSQPIFNKMPVAMTLGNHDYREHFLDIFTATAGERQNLQDKYVVVIDHPKVQLILLDSLLSTNVTPGFLGKLQRKWLENHLKENKNKAIFLFFHHTLSDGDNDLLDVDKLFDIITPHRQVKAVFYGHSHVYHYSTQNDIHLINLPALGYTFDDKDPVGWIEASIDHKSGSFTLHAIEGNTALDGEKKEVIWRI